MKRKRLHPLRKFCKDLVLKIQLGRPVDFEKRCRKTLVGARGAGRAPGVGARRLRSAEPRPGCAAASLPDLPNLGKIQQRCQIL